MVSSAQFQALSTRVSSVQPALPLPRATTVHVFATHGHPFAFAQASRLSDPTKSTSLSGTPALLPARGSPEPAPAVAAAAADTAARNGLAICASTARSVGSSRGSTSAAKRPGYCSRNSSNGGGSSVSGPTLVHFSAQRMHFLLDTLGGFSSV